MSHHDDAELEKFLKGESALSKLYRSGQKNGPPAHLDQKIMARARHALDDSPAQRVRKTRPAWLVPLSVAATLALGINLAFNLKDFRQEQVYDETKGIAYSERSRPWPGDALTAPAADSNAARPPMPAPAAPERSLLRAEGVADAVSTPAAKEITPELYDRQEEDFGAVRSASGDFSDTSNLRRARSNADNGATLTTKAPANTQAPPQAQSQPQTRILADAEVQARKDGFAPPPPQPPEAVAKVARESVTRDAEYQAGERRQRQEASTLPMREAGRSTNAEVTSGAAEAALSPGDLASAPDEPTAVAPVIAGDTPDSVSLDRQAMTIQKTSIGNTNQGADHNGQVEEIVDDADEQFLPESDDHAAPLSMSATPDYVCDLQALGINQEAIVATRNIARDTLSPLTARTWMVEIRRLARLQQYPEACRHLAAYIDTFGRGEYLTTLPIKIPAQIPD